MVLPDEEKTVSPYSPPIESLFRNMVRMQFRLKSNSPGKKGQDMGHCGSRGVWELAHVSLKKCQFFNIFIQGLFCTNNCLDWHMIYKYVSAEQFILVMNQPVTKLEFAVKETLQVDLPRHRPVHRLLQHGWARLLWKCQTFGWNLYSVLTNGRLRAPKWIILWIFFQRAGWGRGGHIKS